MELVVLVAVFYPCGIKFCIHHSVLQLWIVFNSLDLICFAPQLCFSFRRPVLVGRVPSIWWRGGGVSLTDTLLDRDLPLGHKPLWTETPQDRDLQTETSWTEITDWCKNITLPQLDASSDIWFMSQRIIFQNH